MKKMGFPWWLSSNEPACQWRSYGFDPWIGKVPWRREWQPTLVFLPGKSHGQRKLVIYRPWGCKRAGHNWVTKTTTTTYKFIHKVLVQCYIFFLKFKLFVKHKGCGQGSSRWNASSMEAKEQRLLQAKFQPICPPPKIWKLKGNNNI